MSLRPQLNVLCGRCGKPRGLFHECVSNSRRRQTLKPTVTFGKCPNCKKTITNPLTHVCAPKIRLQEPQGASTRRSSATGRARSDQQQAHDYTECSDNDCPRALCVAFKTGWKAGDEDGYDRGWQQGQESRLQGGLREGLSRRHRRLPARPQVEEAPVDQVLIVLALIAGYAVFLLVKPEKTCRRCRGWGARGKRRTLLHALPGHRASGSASAPGSSTAAPPRRYRYARTRKRMERPAVTILIKTSGGGGVVLLVGLALLMSQRRRRRHGHRRARRRPRRRGGGRPRRRRVPAVPCAAFRSPGRDPCAPASAARRGPASLRRARAFAPVVRLHR